MRSVKTSFAADTVSGRLAYLRRLLNPLGRKPLGWKDFAKFAGRPVGTAKNWANRNQIGHEAATVLAERMTAAGYPCTAAWILHGEGATPTSAPPREGGRVAEPGRAPYLAGPPPFPLPLEDIATIAELAAHAVRATVEKNELHTGRDGYGLVIQALEAFAERLRDLGVDRVYLADLYMAIGELGRMKQLRLDPPNGAAASAPSGSTT